MRRSSAVLAVSAVAAVGAAAALASTPGSVKAVAAGAQAPARTATVRGTGQDKLRFSSVAKRRSATRWCLKLTVRRTVDEEGAGGESTWSGEGFCGTIRRETALKIAFACPYGVGASGLVDGRPDRVEFVGANGVTLRAVTKRVADRTGNGTLWATSVAAASLPGRIVARDGGRSRTVTDLDALTDICA